MHSYTLKMSKAAKEFVPNTEVIGRNLKLSWFREEAWTDELLNFKRRWSGVTKAELLHDEIVAAYISFFDSIGCNPKKQPPSMVGLITRFFIKENSKPFPKIHPVVDAVNIAAVDTLIPLGVFDNDRVQGELCVDVSNGGELFLPLGAKEAVELPAGKLVLRDDQNILSEYGVRDSQHQMIRPVTSRVGLLACSVPGMDRGAIEHGLEKAEHFLRKIYPDIEREDH